MWSSDGKAVLFSGWREVAMGDEAPLLTAAPLKIVHGSGSPLRVLVLVE